MATMTVSQNRRLGPQYRARVCESAAFLRGAAAMFVRRLFPRWPEGRAAKKYAPLVPEWTLSRWRSDGGPVGDLSVLFRAMHDAGDGPEAADEIIAFLQAQRDAEWCEPVDLLALHVAEAEAEGVENVATIRYEQEPTPERALELAAAIRREQAVERERVAALVRVNMKGGRA